MFGLLHYIIQSNQSKSVQLQVLLVRIIENNKIDANYRSG